ncbi:MAG: ATP-binding protein [Bacteroidota bacterium]|nr:ATP-binding protein [Bacteroidota bacterium]
MQNWENSALELLVKSLDPIPQELNQLDWKADLSQKEERFHDHLSAFANYEGGGYLVFGVTRQGKVLGIEHLNTEEILKKIGNIARDGLEPAVTIDYSIKSFREKNLLFIHVLESSTKPVHLRGQSIEEAFTRSAGQTRKMTKEDIRKAILISQPLRYEEIIAYRSSSVTDILQRLEYIRIFEMLNLPVPQTSDAICEQLGVQKILKKVGGEIGITNLGVLLGAKELQNFSGKERKGVRVIKYVGTSREKTEREQEGKRGYAVGFEGLIQYIQNLLPASEVIKEALRKEVTIYPVIAIRELVANALIHQDLTASGMSPMVEIFDDRIEITNPGRLLPTIRIERLIDTAPDPRNDLLAKFMRRLNICEERGSGIDKALLAIEMYGMPPPEFIEGENYFKAILYSPRPFNRMTKDERIRACYFHCCLKHVANDRMTNTTLRERFKIEEKNYPIVSAVIKDTLAKRFIKLGDPESKSRKHAYYVPFWA